MEQITDIESTSLAAHVSICQQRYHHLDMRIQNVERRIEKIEGLVVDIHEKIADLAERQNQRWDKSQVAIIGTLIAITGYLFIKGFLT